MANEVKFDLARLDDLVDLMEEHHLGEIEVEDGPNMVSIARRPPKRKSRAGKTAREPESPFVTVTASRVGVFSLKVAAGDTVTENQVLGEIRMMDVTYAINSPAAGEVTEVLVEDGVGVEFGQPVIRLNTEGF